MDEKRSSIWKYFQLVDNAGHRKTQCNICKTVLAYSGSTSSMRNHIKFKHKSICPEAFTTPGEKKKSGPARRNSVKSFPHEKRDLIIKALAQWCATDIRPVSAIEGEGFTYLVKELNPSFSIPCRQSIIEQLTLMHQQSKAELTGLLTDCPVSLTADVWTNIDNNTFIALTANFISSDWKLESKLLATRELADGHTGINIAWDIKKVTSEFGIADADLVTLTTDNSSNMAFAARQSGIAQVHCFTHTMQHAINDGLKIEAISNAIYACRRLVSYLCSFESASNALVKIQEWQGIKSPLSLIQDVPNNWNRTYQMMKRLLRLKVHVYAVLNDDTIVNPCDRPSVDMNENEWKVMDSVVPLLEPFEHAAELLTKPDLPSGSCVYVLIHTLITTELSYNALDSSVITELKGKIRSSLESRYGIIPGESSPSGASLTSAFMVATMLDPRHKNLRFLNQWKKDIIVTHVTLLAEGSAESIPHTEASLKLNLEGEDYNPSPAKKRLLDCIMGEVNDLTSEASGPRSPSEELQNYLREPVRIVSPLTWWKENSDRFPCLSKLARRFLSIPASGKTCEKHVTKEASFNKLRVSLDADTVDPILFINKNGVNLEKKELKMEFVAPQGTPSTSTSQSVWPGL